LERSTSLTQRFAASGEAHPEASVADDRDTGREAHANRELIGIAFMLGFSSLTAAKEVISGATLQRTDPFLLVFSTFSLTAALFHLYGWSAGQPQAVQAQHRRDLVMINVASTCSWIFFFYALKYIEPALVTSIITATGPLITLGLDTLVRRRRTISSADLLAGTAILFSTAYLIWVASSGRSAFSASDRFAVGVALAGCAFSGISVAVTTVYSKRLYDRGWTPSRLMAHRFYLLILTSGVLSLGADDWLGQLRRDWLLIGLIACGGVALPLYVLQLGIQRCSPLTVATIIAVGPAFTILFELFDRRLKWSLASFWGVLALVSVVLWSTWHGREKPAEA
jgi:drug/metabolite transporter (DMT)-like permease